LEISENNGIPRIGLLGSLLGFSILSINVKTIRKNNIFERLDDFILLWNFIEIRNTIKINKISNREKKCSLPKPLKNILLKNIVLLNDR
jgi:hypothetical protein